MQGEFPLRSDFEWKKLGDTYQLTNKSTGRDFKLDPVSFLVWIQCDGKTTVDEIVDVFSVGGNRDIIKTTITGVLEKLTEGKAIEWV